MDGYVLLAAALWRGLTVIKIKESGKEENDDLSARKTKKEKKRKETNMVIVGRIIFIVKGFKTIMVFKLSIMEKKN